MKNSANILIVDDSKVVRSALRKSLEKSGYKIIAEADNGESCLEAYTKFKPDLTILDMVMPDTVNLEPLDRIREINPSAKVIMLSALATPEKVKKAILKGASYFLIKPFEEDELLEIVKRIIEKN